MALIFGGLMVAPTRVPQASNQPASVDEMLTFECARHVVELAVDADQKGPVFVKYGLALTSVSLADGSIRLLVNGGAGQFILPLAGAGVNRLRFYLPIAGETQPKQFYISYLHGLGGDSRVFDFSVGRAPAGRDDLDFSVHNPVRAPQFLPNMDFAIYQTLEVMVREFSARRVKPSQIAPVNVRSCDHVARQSSSLARGIRYNLEYLKTASHPAPSRMPASVASVPATFCGQKQRVPGFCGSR